MTPEIAQFRPHARRRWLLAAGLVALVASGIWGWESVLKDNIIPKRFGVVEEGRIYRSGQLSATLVKKVLAEHNIRVIVDLTSVDLQNPDQQAEGKAAAELNIKLMRFPLEGNGTGDLNEYTNAIAAIADAAKNNLPVLVHCAAGAQRTGGVIAIYRLLVQKTDPNIVEDEIEKYGCDIDNKPVLRAFLNDNMNEFALRLKQAGVIDQIPAVIPLLPRD
ncbi:MAG: tyrosine-protein phosphatase [Sedimentisphaerales bacterium]|jgi:protein tyrosine/serine phosphatase